MAGVLEPEVAGEEGLELGGEEAHLRRELAELLADELEAVGELRAQEDDGVAEQEAVLGRAEGDDVDAAVGGQLGEAAPSEAAALASRAPSTWRSIPSSWAASAIARGLVEGVDGAELGRLGDRDDPLLGVVVVARRASQRPTSSGRELAVLGRDGEELDAGDALGGAALVDVHVGGLGADHGLEAAGQRVERGDVGAGSVEDGEAAGVGAEVLAEELLDALGPGVAAVGAGVALVGVGDRLEDLGVDAGVVVGGEAPWQRHGWSGEPGAVHLRGGVGEQVGDRRRRCPRSR